VTGHPTTSTGSSTIAQALQEIADGGMVVVVDDEDREDEGDLIMAAEHATAEDLAFIVRHTSGVVCVALTGERCDALELPPMVPVNTEQHSTAFTHSVDLAAGTTTGISAAERAATIRGLADPALAPADFSRPGHVFPLRARGGGVLERAGHTEAAVDLARLAGLAPAGLLCEVVNDDGTMARRPDLERFVAEHGLPIVTIADLVEHRRRTEELRLRHLLAGLDRAPALAGHGSAAR
jgi:3,4-dihydroxy 2-butanone 4-phosphate synthase / GTP cyclohydrolase II